MKKIIQLRVFACLFGMLMSTCMFAQNVISGTITSSSGETLIGANVVIKGTSEGTNTDLDGKYQISTSASFPLTLEVSYTGYIGKDIKVVNTSNEVDVVLQEGVTIGEEVVVSASRRREKIQEAPASVSIITSRKLEASPNDDPVRAIINETGVFIQQQGAGRVNIQLRGDAGITGTSSFPILDYRSLKAPGLDAFENLNSPLNGLDIDRIEVVRGPGSALYGPGVTAGVVHFISKSPIDKPGTSIELMGGELETYGISLRHATKVSDKFGFKINASHKRGGEFLLDPVEDAAFIAGLKTSVSTPSITNDLVDATIPGRVLVENLDEDGDGNPIQNYWKSQLLTASLEFRPQDDLSINVAGGMNFGTGPLFTNQGVGITTATEFWTQARVQKGGFFAQAIFLNHNGGTDDTPTFLYNTGTRSGIPRQQIEGQLQYNFDTPDFLNANWTAGFDYRLSTADTEHSVYGRNEDDDDFGVVGGYVQTKLALVDKLDLVIAARVDKFNFLDDLAFAPRAVFVYKMDPKHTFRAGFNRAIAAPTQLAVNIDFPVNTIIPGKFDFWLLGNKTAQTFGDDPQIVFNGVFPFPNIPVGTPGMPLGFIQAAVSGGVVPGVTDGLTASNPIFEQFAGSISEFLSSPANYAAGTSGEFVGINFFTKQPMGLVDAPAAALKIEDSWEIGYKGIFADKFSVSVDVYNRKVDGSTILTAVGPAYSLQGTEGLPGDLGAGVNANFAPFLTDLLAPLVGSEIADQAALEALVAQATGVVGGAYGAGAAGFLQQIAGFNGPSLLATTPTEQAPDNGTTHLSAGFRTFEAYDYWGMDVGTNYFINNDFTVFANYSWVSENEFMPNIKGSDVAARFVQGLPKNRFRLGLNYTPEFGLRANVAFQHDPSFPVAFGPFNGDTDVKNLVDAGVGYKLDNGLSLSVSAQNLLNNKYRTFPGFPIIGRRAMATIQYTFGVGQKNSN